MKGEVGELKENFDFAPQSRYHASLSTHTCVHYVVHGVCVFGLEAPLCYSQQSYRGSGYFPEYPGAHSGTGHRSLALSVIHWFENRK